MIPARASLLPRTPRCHAPRRRTPLFPGPRRATARRATARHAAARRAAARRAPRPYAQARGRVAVAGPQLREVATSLAGTRSFGGFLQAAPAPSPRRVPSAARRAAHRAAARCAAACRAPSRRAAARRSPRAHRAAACRTAARRTAARRLGRRMSGDDHRFGVWSPGVSPFPPLPTDPCRYDPLVAAASGAAKHRTQLSTSRSSARSI